MSRTGNSSSRAGENLRVRLLLVTVFISGCVSLTPAERIIGQWQTDLNGFPVMVAVTGETITVVGQEPVAYILEADTLSMASSEHAVIRIEFPSKNEMLQTNVSTGEVQRYTRQASP